MTGKKQHWFPANFVEVKFLNFPKSLIWLFLGNLVTFRQYGYFKAFLNQHFALTPWTLGYLIAPLETEDARLTTMSLVIKTFALL